MISRSRRLRTGALSLFLVLTVGCAGGAGPGQETSAAGPAAPDGMTVLTVQNNHSLGVEMTIFFEPEGRAERIRVGVVGPGDTREFTLEVPRGYFRIVGEHNTGDVRSDRFNITGPSTLRWVMRTARVELRRR